MKNINRLRCVLALLLCCLFLDDVKAQQTSLEQLEESFNKGVKQDLAWVDEMSKVAFNLWQSAPQKGIEYSQKILEVAIKLDYDRGQAAAYRSMGACYYILGNHEKTRECYFNSYYAADRAKDNALMRSALSNLGSSFLSTKDTLQAIRYYKESASKESKNKRSSTLRNNLSGIYTEMGQYDSALYFLNEGIYIAKNEENLSEIRTRSSLTFLLINKADALIRKEEFRQAELAMKEASTYLVALNSDYINGRYHKIMAHLYEKTNRYRLAEKEYLKAIKISEAQGYKDATRIITENLSHVYEKLGADHKALKMLQKYVVLNEEAYAIEKGEQMAEMEAKYEKVKAQKENELQKQQLILQEQELSAQRIIRNFFICAIIVFLIMLVGLYRGNVLKRKMNNVLRKQKTDLQEQANTLLELNEEIQTQKEVLEDKNVLLIDQNTQITSSIKAAQLMQEGLLPSLSELKTSFNDVFTVYLPKDIVSGDIFWSKKINNVTAVAAIDCTGHGVPGAFMSMQAYALLEEGTNLLGLENPAKVLDFVQKRLMAKINTSKNLSEFGMDLALCCIENISEKESRVQFVGAKRPLYYSNKREFCKLKGDNISIGKRSKLKADKVFETQELILEKGSMIYLTTDGYVDTCNKLRQKIGSKQFEEILKDNIDQDLSYQEKILKDTLEKHRDDAPMRDDVTIFGIQL